MASNISPAPKHVLITGCSTGIGLACARWLAARGSIVHAGVRKDADATTLAVSDRVVEGPSAIRPIRIDVADVASVAAAADELERRCGADGLFALVNNAGISVNGPAEMLTPADWRRQFDVNLFGQIDVTRACLPLLRRSVEQHGRARIVMMSSIAGTVAQPILGPYCASKHALNAVAGALRVELRAQKIGVSIVAPGAIKSEIWKKAQDAAAQEVRVRPADERYGTLVNAIIALARKAEEGAIPAEHVARAVERCLVSKSALAHVYVGTDAKSAAFAKRWLPGWMFEGLMRRMVGVP